jgi:galactose mutarotase-like enzyme
MHEHEHLQAVTLRTDRLWVEVLPALGGKIASMRWLPRNLELLQAPLIPYRPRTPWMKFEDSDASGFDECIPSIAECEVDLPSGRVHVPDHGDFWRIPCRCTQLDDGIRMEGTSEHLPLRFERTLRVTEDIPMQSSHLQPPIEIRKAATLEITYRLWNIGKSPTEYLWSAHPLFAVEVGDRIRLPDSMERFAVEWSAQQRLGGAGDILSWPQAKSNSGEEVDLSTVGERDDNVADKLYGAAPAEGWAVIERSRYGLRIEILFDPVQAPFLGLWLCNGGWPEGKPSRQHCVAIEPCMAPTDSLARAIKSGWAKRLACGEMHTWSMQIRVQEN